MNENPNLTNAYSFVIIKYTLIARAADEHLEAVGEPRSN